MGSIYHMFSDVKEVIDNSHFVSSQCTVSISLA